MLRTRDLGKEGTESLYALQDETWDIVALCDGTGAVVERFLYDPCGKSKVVEPNFTADSDGVSDYDWNYRFTTQEWDGETSLHYFNARCYHDQLGRFVGRDPLGYVDGMSLYAAYFAPAATDPLGAKSCIFSMDSANPEDCKRWDLECRKLQEALPGSAYYGKAWYQQSILSRILQNGCCDVHFVGHQGRDTTNGGIVTYHGNNKVKLLPDPVFESQLSSAFTANGCSSCTISLYACGGNMAAAPATRTGIANGTGCTVNGAVPPPRDPLITIGYCPGQKWYTLDPNGAEGEGPGDGSYCAGPVPMERYDPWRGPEPQRWNPFGGMSPIPY